MNTYLQQKLYESMRLNESKSLDTNLVENLEDKIKSEFLNCLQDITRRFEKWTTDELFTTPIKIVDIYEVPSDEGNLKYYKAYPPMPCIGVECKIGVNTNFDTSSGVKGMVGDYVYSLGGWLKLFSDKLDGDCTSGLRPYSKVVQKTTILNNGFRYEVCDIDNPDLEYNSEKGKYEYYGGSTHTFIIRMRPVKMRRK